MSAELTEEHSRALADLISFRQPILDVIARVRALPWDSDDELVVLDRHAVLSVLMIFRSGELSPGHLELWAETIECREDVGLEKGQEELLGQFIFETANPSLAQPLAEKYASTWVDRLRPPA